MRLTRQAKILELISSKNIETQEELLAELVRADYIVTQATISRDIKELGLIKITTENKKQKYARGIDAEQNIPMKIRDMFCHAVISIDNAMNIVVIRTVSGAAGTAGMLVDKLGITSVLGSVAGDDTVIIVTKNEEVAQSIVEKLNSIINQ